MIQIDMPMPTNCLDCPACNEYLMCAIPVNGRGWGENDVREFGQGRPEWCPMKEQKAVEPKTEPSAKGYWYTCGVCGWWLFEVRDTVHFDDRKRIHYCASCGKAVKWE